MLVSCYGSSIPKTPHGFLSQPLWLVSGGVGERMGNMGGFEHQTATPLIGRIGGITLFTHLFSAIYRGCSSIYNW